MLKKTPALAPLAPKKPYQRHFHDFTLSDDYFWLKADHWQEVMKKPDALPVEIAAYLNAENAYSAAYLAPYEDLQKKLITEMRGRIKEDDSSVPSKDGAYAYFRKFRKGGEHMLFCREFREGGNEEILLDGDLEAKGKKFFQFGGISHSRDHKLLAWSYDDKGSEFYTIVVRDLNSGKELSDRVANTSGGIVWTADNKAFYYVRLNDDHRPQFVYRHTLGTPQESDEKIYEEADPGFFIGLGETLSRRFCILSCHDHETSENWLIDLHGNGAPRCVSKRMKGRIYGIDDGGDEFFILTNADGAEDFKIVTAPANAPQANNWRDLVPHRTGIYIMAFTVTSTHLIRLERENGLPRLVVRERKNGQEHTIAFDEEAYALGLRAGYEFDTENLRFVYASPTTPTEVWDYDLTSRKRTLRKREIIPSGHDSTLYVTKRLFAVSHDKEKVPITLLMRKDTKLDGSAPLYLHGYGSYGLAISADFRTNPLSLVDRGMIFAIAHVRGGAEKGRRWYLDGKREKKPNSFKDFIACAEHLIAQGYTSHGNIVAHGGSAGGLLMGAVANMRPDLFRAIIAEVPFVDALNTMLDDTLPLTPPEWPEWGNPIESREDYLTIRAYSPYDNILAQDYPAIFALGGLTDPRVTYWEPAKWVARLREFNTSRNPLLLKINMAAGHGGASGRFRHLEEIGLIYAFALAMAGKS